MQFRCLGNHAYWFNPVMEQRLVYNRNLAAPLQDVNPEVPVLVTKYLAAAGHLYKDRFVAWRLLKCRPPNQRAYRQIVLTHLVLQGEPFWRNAAVQQPFVLHIRCDDAYFLISHLRHSPLKEIRVNPVVRVQWQDELSVRLADAAVPGRRQT